MLIELTPNKNAINDFESDYGNNYFFVPLSDRMMETGIYIQTAPVFWFEEFLEDGYWECIDNKKTWGIADNIQQIKDHFSNEIADPNVRYIIGVNVHHQNKNEPNMGFKWKSGGPYIGSYLPRCEYLNDEKFDLNYVFTFQLYRIFDSDF